MYSPSVQSRRKTWPVRLTPKSVSKSFGADTATVRLAASPTSTRVSTRTRSSYQFVVTPEMRWGAPDMSVVQFGNDSDGCDVRRTKSAPPRRSPFRTGILRETSTRKPSMMT